MDPSGGSCLMDIAEELNSIYLDLDQLSETGNEEGLSLD